FHLVTVALYARQPDRFAAFTLFPIWIWGSVGLSLSSSAFIFFRAPLSLFTSGAWALTILFVADETRPLGRLGTDGLQPGTPGRYGGRDVIRVATINWAGSAENFSEPIVRYRPDIVFVQEINHPYRLRQLNEILYDGRGDYRYDSRTRCGMVVRGEIEHHIPNPVYRSQQVRMRLPNGRRVELVNIHLQPASTDLSLWRRDCWRAHHHNRKLRRGELAVALQLLDTTNRDPRVPAVIIAGDFNAPAGDRVYRMLRKEYIDTFSAAGSGWGNTYHRRFPLLRLDHIFASKSFVPARSRVVTINESDHRMVLSDLILQ
ncbi:MAG: hypothetical protein GWO24_24015, partial [Akkermansiaceae bacterium]|nr:hypothetical protein [Akkermansiaceae bacterium]